jgi:hypothetical protein
MAKLQPGVELVTPIPVLPIDPGSIPPGTWRIMLVIEDVTGRLSAPAVAILIVTPLL